jgi:endonuclease-3
MPSAQKPKKTALKSTKTTAKQAAAKTVKAAKKSGTQGAKAPARAAATKRKTASGDRSPERVTEILRRLRAAYPDAECALLHRSPWELLVATILSAQCTDARVNMVTPKLFRDFPTPQAMAQATPEAIEEYVKSTGFYRNKAKSIHGAAKRLVEVYGGKLPETMDELLTLPGAARKTANVVLGVAFGKAEGVVVDTHVLRLSNRLGLVDSDDPKKVEQELMRILPRERWIQFSHEMIHHGRQVCDARKPKCEMCPLEDLCHSRDKTWSSRQM